MYVPSFKHPVTQALALSIKKRRKALKYKSTDASLDRVMEEIDGQRMERLEFSIELAHPIGARLSLSLWEDRWIWIDARRGSKTGWVFEWSQQGRLVIGSGEQLESALERSIDIIGMGEDVLVEKLELFWSKILSEGRNAVRGV